MAFVKHLKKPIYFQSYTESYANSFGSSFELDFTKKFKCTICPYFSCSSISLDQGWSDGFDLAQRLEVTKPTTKPMIMAKMAAQDVDKAKVRSEYTG